MSDYLSPPLQDAFETTLSTDLNGSDTTVPLTAVPDFTVPGGQKVYAVIDYDKPSTKYEVISFTGKSGNNLTGVTRGIAKYYGGASTATSHGSGAKVIISDNWKNWEDIKTAIDSKLDETGGTMSGLLQFSGTDHAGIRLINLSTAQRDALGAPANGNLIYNTTTNTVQKRENATWKEVGEAKSGANSDITSLSGLTTPLSVAQGGTGAATHTANSVLIGQGTSAITSVAPGAASNVLVSNGTNWVSGAQPPGAAHALLSNTNITDADNSAVARGALVYGNTTPKWSALPIGGNSKVLGSNGTDPSWVDMDPEYWPFIGVQTATIGLDSQWGGAMFANNTRLLGRDVGTATTLNYYLKPSARSAFIANAVARAGLGINQNMGIRVKDGSTEYLLTMADGGNSPRRYDTDGQNETTITFSGTAPTAARRIGYDEVNGHVWIADGANKAATQIRRYTLSGTVLTNINSDITLSGTAPSNAGSGNMLIGNTYMVLQDVVTTPRYRRYNKTTGAYVDEFTWTAFNGNEAHLGFVISSNNKLYVLYGFGAAANAQGKLALFDLG